MEKYEFKNDVLDVLYRYNLLEKNKTISNLIILSDTDNEIYFNINGIQKATPKEIKTDFCLELLKILKKYELIGNQSHIQELELIFEEDKLSVINISQFFLNVKPTIFEQGEV